MGSLVLEGSRGMARERGGSGSLIRTKRWGFLAARRISDWVKCFLRALVEREHQDITYKSNTSPLRQDSLCRLQHKFDKVMLQSADYPLMKAVSSELQLGNIHNDDTEYTWTRVSCAVWQIKEPTHYVVGGALSSTLQNSTDTVSKMYLVSFVATNTTGLGASPWLTFCLLMTDWEVVLIPEVYGLPLAG